MSDAESDEGAGILVALIQRMFEANGLCGLAPGQVEILKRIRGGAASFQQIADALGAHPAIVRKAIISLERKGLVVPLTPSRNGEKRFRLTAIAQIFLDPSAARHVTAVIASRHPDGPISLEELVAALSADLQAR